MSGKYKLDNNGDCLNVTGIFQTKSMWLKSTVPGGTDKARPRCLYMSTEQGCIGETLAWQFNSESESHNFGTDVERSYITNIHVVQ